MRIAQRRRIPLVVPQAIRLDPLPSAPINTHWSIGTIYDEAGTYTLALDNYRRYVELAGDSADQSVLEMIEYLSARLGS